MKEETLSKILVWVLVVIGMANWTIGFFKDQWQAVASGLVSLIVAVGIYTNMRVTRIERKLGMSKRR